MSTDDAVWNVTSLLRDQNVVASEASVAALVELGGARPALGLKHRRPTIATAQRPQPDITAIGEQLGNQGLIAWLKTAGQ